MNVVDFYTAAYTDPAYRTKRDRLWNLASYLQGIRAKHGAWTFMDIGCGRGEAIEEARCCGFDAQGAEIVPALCGPRVHQVEPGAPLPFADKEFHVVTSIDVLEHIPQGDYLTQHLQELYRITYGWLYLGISTRHGRGHLTVQDAESWAREIGLAGIVAPPKGLTPLHHIENYVYFEIRGEGRRMTHDRL